jgi:hypothetical protein
MELLSLHNSVNTILTISPFHDCVCVCVLCEYVHTNKIHIYMNTTGSSSQDSTDYQN